MRERAFITGLCGGEKGSLMDCAYRSLLMAMYESYIHEHRGNAAIIIRVPLLGLDWISSPGGRH